MATLGIMDCLSEVGEAAVLAPLEEGESRDFLCSPGENLGIKLFLSDPAVYDEVILGAGERARGEGALLLPTGGVFG